MPTARESLWEIEKMVVFIDSDPLPPCITLHPDFGSVCVCRTVLTVSLHSYRYHYGISDVPTDENGYVYK